MGRKEGDILFVRAPFHNCTDAIAGAMDMASSAVCSASAIWCSRLDVRLPHEEVVDRFIVDWLQGNAPLRILQVMLLALRHQLWQFCYAVRPKLSVVHTLSFGSAFAAAAASLVTNARFPYATLCRGGLW